MRYASKRRLLLATILTAGLYSCVCIAPVKAETGLTVTPATATLSLSKDEAEARSAITITNNYAAALALEFRFAGIQNATPQDKRALQALRVATPTTILQPGQTFTQTVILAATDALAPGSQQVDLILSQATTSGGAIGVLPELRLPLIIVKEAGAITRTLVTGIQHPALGLRLPSEVNATLQNTGNMITIPRGVITITAPNGTVIGKGTLNSASTALSPGANTRFRTAITPLANAFLPGPYTITITHGQGGGAPAQTTRARFLYVAWWHIACAIIAFVAAYYALRTILPRHPYRHLKHRPPPKRLPLVRKGVV